VAFDDTCQAYQELHSAIDTLRAAGVSLVEISASVERALLPNAQADRAGEVNHE
jgi:hypothetical protein